MISGVCRYCGCTTERACRPRDERGRPGEPCQWIDQEETLCSACVGRLSEEELQHFWLQEFAPYAPAPLPPIETDCVTAFSVVAALQLALKHPQCQKNMRHGAALVRETADALAAVLANVGPVTAEVHRRGFAGCYQPDAPHTQTEPAIIIPGA